LNQSKHVLFAFLVDRGARHGELNLLHMINNTKFHLKCKTNLFLMEEKVLQYYTNRYTASWLGIWAHIHGSSAYNTSASAS